MKISYSAFIEDMTISELFLRAVIKSYNYLTTNKLINKFEKITGVEYDEVFQDMLRGRANLKCIIWYKNKEVLENELGFKKVDYDYMYDEFIVKEVRNICNSSKAINLF